MDTILITGGSGLIGKRLTELLLKRGCVVHHLGRGNGNDNADDGAKHFVWDIERKKIDKAAFTDVKTIIHLAGAGVAEKRWTLARKREITDSRVKSGNLLYSFLENEKHQVKTFVSAGAVGYYSDCGDEVVTEEHKPGKDFLAKVCKKWEQPSQNIGQLGIREIRCRIGLVLAANGGALPELIKTVPFGFASFFLKQPLWYPWVHIDDVCGAIIYAVASENMQGPYNITAPLPTPMKTLMKHILAVKKSNALLLPAPTPVIELALGEMSDMLLSSQRCSAGKLLNAGYQFTYADLTTALKDVLK